MTLVSNDPSLWSTISFYHISSYCVGASSAALVYDWALTFGQEFDLVWRKRWTFMTVLYLIVRYTGILFAVCQVLTSSTSITLTDEHNDPASCYVLFIMQNWMSVIGNAILGVIMITRLHAMYENSRRILIFLVVVLSVVTISCTVIAIIQSKSFESEELIFSGNHQCAYMGDNLLQIAATWILGAVWEVLALCLAVWITVKNLRELPSGWTLRDLFRVLIKTHVLYFAFFAATVCLNLAALAPSLMYSSNMTAVGFYNGVIQISGKLVLFVLGPRLVLSIRQYHAKVVAASDEGTTVTVMKFQERPYISTISSV